MKNPKNMVIALITATVVIAGSLASRAQTTQQDTDQNKSDSSTDGRPKRPAPR